MMRRTMMTMTMTMYEDICWASCETLSKIGKLLNHPERFTMVIKWWILWVMPRIDVEEELLLKMLQHCVMMTHGLGMGFTYM